MDQPKDIQNAEPFSPSPTELDPGMALKLARECFESSTSWLNAGRRMEWSNSLRAFQNLHGSGSKYLSTDYRYRSRLFRPKTRAMVRRAEATTAAAFFSNEDVVTISAQDDNDKMQQASAELMQRLLQHRLTKTIPWFLTLVGARQDAEIMGICIGKAYWKYGEKVSHTESRFNELGEMEDYDVFVKTDDHPWIDLTAPENFRFDPGADWRNPVATSPYLIEMIPMYLADVKAKIASGEWNEVSDGALRAATDIDNDDTRRSREQGRVPGKDNDVAKPREFDICWVRENIIRYAGQDWHFYSLSSQLLTKPRPLSEVYLQGIRPYVCGMVMPEAHKTYPAGKVELTRDLQTATNDVMNLRLDNVKLALNPRQFIRTGSQIDPQDARTFMPAKVILANNPKDDIVWDRPPEVTTSSYQEQDRINLDWDELSGGTSNSSIQSNRQVYEAVGNMEMMQGNGSTLEEYEQRVFAETFVEPIIRQLIKLEQAYETDPVILALAGNEAQLIQKFGMNQITDELLRQELTIRVNVGLGATNPQKKLQNFLTAAQAIGQIFGPAASMGSNFEEVTKEVFSLCGYKDGERFFEPGFDIRSAQMQMSQKGGKGTDPQAEIAIANAEQAAQAQQEIMSRKLDMQETLQSHQLKMEEMQQKFNLEIEKERMKLGMQQHKQMQEMATRPVQLHSDDLQKSSQNIEGMAERHNTAMENLSQILTPLAHATIQHGQTLERMLHHNAQGHETLAKAVDNLAKAHSTPKKRRAIRDDKGKLIGAEEYV